MAVVAVAVEMGGLNLTRRVVVAVAAVVVVVAAVAAGSIRHQKLNFND